MPRDEKPDEGQSKLRAHPAAAALPEPPMSGDGRRGAVDDRRSAQLRGTMMRTMRVDDLLRMDSYRNSALAYFASRDCVKGCNLVLSVRGRKTSRAARAPRPQFRVVHGARLRAAPPPAEGSSIMAVFRHYGTDRGRLQARERADAVHACALA